MNTEVTKTDESKDLLDKINNRHNIAFNHEMMMQILMKIATCKDESTLEGIKRLSEMTVRELKSVKL